VVSVGATYIDIRGIDFVDGTLVLDIKPYLPFDSISFDTPLPMATDNSGVSLLSGKKLKVPSWIHDSDILLRKVIFSPEALETLRLYDEEKKMKLCTSANEARELITQVLRQDIRATHQGRGQGSAETYKCRVDSFDIEFTTGEYIVVQQISPSTTQSL